MAVTRSLQGRTHDLGGGMIVRRLLPNAGQAAIGPFVFFDHFGPIDVRPENNFDVRPHPHIGLATVTFLFDGAMLHRDSLGNAQRIEPGAINWMTAGRGIVHSERRPEDLREHTYGLHGLQLWAALPVEHEEAEPAFLHTPAAHLPIVAQGGATVRILIGTAFGLISPVTTYGDTLYLDVNARPGATLSLEPSAQERAVYCVDKEVTIDAMTVRPGTLAVLQAEEAAHILSPHGARYLVIGGATLEGRRHLWWNFVSSRKSRIEEAKTEWAARRMGDIPGEAEWIPLPTDR
jgi:redox-sensitive bicupin YhaK (pirin superfamily)